MAKTFTGVRAFIQFRKETAGTWTLRAVSYNDPLDDADADVRYINAHLPGDPRGLTGSELAGTLQAFLDACDDEFKTANGIV